LRLDAAQTEEAWKDTGKHVGLLVWRIEKFKVVEWPKERYGQFYSGDSYIVLNTQKQKPNEPKLYHGGFDSDEAGTAAYKTVELDDYLGTEPVQHREVQGSENPLFLGYFKEFQILNGGVESGFNHVTPTEYRPRLLHLSAPKRIPGKPAPNVCIREVRTSAENMNSGDVFIYDSGVQILQWNGLESAGVERVKAAEFSRRLSDSRKGLAKVTVFDQGDDDAAFFKAFNGDASQVKPNAAFVETAFEPSLHCLSDESGKPVFTQVGSGASLSRALLKSEDVFILDTADILFVWIGSGASKSEKGLALKTAVQYINDKGRPQELAITRVREGGESGDFLGIFSK
ncbi:MAG: hypothetical protein SGCHY_004231, partial [Lobulomycetales sp.]